MDMVEGGRGKEKGGSGDGEWEKDRFVVENCAEIMSAEMRVERDRQREKGGKREEGGTKEGERKKKGR
jgi:hypothetical protein